MIWTWQVLGSHGYTWQHMVTHANKWHYMASLDWWHHNKLLPQWRWTTMSLKMTVINSADHVTLRCRSMNNIEDFYSPIGKTSVANYSPAAWLWLQPRAAFHSPVQYNRSHHQRREIWLAWPTGWQTSHLHYDIIIFLIS